MFDRMTQEDRRMQHRRTHDRRMFGQEDRRMQDMEM